MKKVFTDLSRLCEFSVRTVQIGSILSMILYIAGLIYRYLAPQSTQFIAMNTIARALFELSPALLVSCIAAALLCDLILRDRKPEE